MLTKLKLARLERGLSQLELGIKAEVPPYKVSLSERRLTILDDGEKERIAKVLGKKVEWLFADEPEELPFGGIGKG